MATLLKFLSSLPTKLSRNIQMVGLVTTAGIASTVYTVDLGHTAVVFNGISKSTFCLNPGIHFLLPWIHTPHVFDVRATIHTLQSTFFTKDDKKISLQFHIVARPNVEHLPTLLNRRGFRYYEILLPTLNSGMNDLGKTYTLSQILEDEIIFSETIPSLLRENAHKNGIILDIVAITSFEYPSTRKWFCSRSRYMMLHKVLGA
ncbi:hypothetical protein LR48_Vigan05g057500 [Vigna angularis]|uniref:Prohibitin n=1 Tax=Phaseolus angularis TaxID=3914 RepID=A0A0L9UJX1_PHAAN|nr:hypothetical protein LR48_Vigan05g057500 [Vigna angularis]